jgi:hypothetical protein
MIVTFRTQANTTFHLDHDNHVWVQEDSGKELRSGPLYNLPSVRVGSCVMICTSDEKCSLRVIVTSPVAHREICL